MSLPPAVAVIGGGAIGVGWAVVFSDAGFAVRLFEPDELRRRSAMGEINGILRRLEDHDLLSSSSGVAMDLIHPSSTFVDAVKGVALVQECVTESLDVKMAVFAESDSLAPRDAVIASSSSSMTASMIAADLPGRNRCTMAHPANPPYLLPVVEIAPAPFTDDDSVSRITDIMTEARMFPVTIKTEIEGLVYNRLQGALLREAYCLVRDGVISANDLDDLVTRGLGRRWSVVGPFTTAHLNTRGGIVAHAERLGDAYLRMAASRSIDEPWSAELVARVEKELTQRIPSDRWDKAVEARDELLMSIVRAISVAD